MAYARTIILILLGCMNAIAQPLTPSELAFGNRGSNSPVAILPPIALPAFYAIPDGTTISSNVFASDPQNFVITYTTTANVTNGIFLGPNGPSYFQPSSTFFWNPAGYIGQDGFSYKVNNGVLDSMIAKVDLFCYATNGTTCGGILTGTNFTLQLPALLAAQDRTWDVYVYESSWFTNQFHHQALDFSPAWMVTGTVPTTLICSNPSPPFIQCYASMTFPTNGAVCIFSTNTPIPPINCGLGNTNAIGAVWRLGNFGSSVLNLTNLSNYFILSGATDPVLCNQQVTNIFCNPDTNAVTFSFSGKVFENGRPNTGINIVQLSMNGINLLNVNGFCIEGQPSPPCGPQTYTFSGAILVQPQSYTNLAFCVRMTTGGSFLAVTNVYAP